MKVGDWVLVFAGGIPRYWGLLTEAANAKGHFVMEDYSTQPHVARKIVGSMVSAIRYQSEAELESKLGTLGLSLCPEEKVPKTEEEKPQPEFHPVVTVTGHRPDKLGGYKVPNPTYDLVVHGLVAAFEHYKPSKVIVGMALGTDQWAAEICALSNIPFIAAIPFDGFESRWPPNSKAKYHKLLSYAEATYVISPGGFEGWKMQKRNEWMVNNCHGVVAVFDGTPGGTANCVGYAVQVGRPIYYVPLQLPQMAVGSNPYAGLATPPQEQKAAPTPSTKRIIDL